jgi:hypothetical protein
MRLASWPGLIAVVLAVISFYGTTYAVIALNMGWRFGYWFSAATFGALMVMLAIFWLVNPVGPRGEEGRWVPIAAGKSIPPVQHEGKSLTSPSQYPGGPWVPAKEGEEAADSFSSAVTSCLSTPPENLKDEAEKKACQAAQSLMPPKDEIPVINGSAVAITPKVTEIQFANEGGELAAGTVRPITIDPRVTKDPKGKLMAPPFKVVAMADKGSLRLPPLMALFIFLAFFLFHLWGLNRAEKNKLNPAVV